MTRELEERRVICISLLEVFHNWGGQEGGTWRTLMVPDQRHGGQDNP